MTGHVVARLVEDLAAEKAEVADLLRTQDESVWATATPALGWTVRDQIAHLEHFDALTRLAITVPHKFTSWRDVLPDLQSYIDAIGASRAGHTGSDLLALWDDENSRVRSAALAADLAVRVPWFGPSMSLASKLTARIMETWAHGQDVFDALGATREPTDRLRHVARIGVLAFPNSFATRGLEMPEVPVRVALDPPGGGDRWEWGDPRAANSVIGPAEDFCLVVTQRRHLDDTSLVVSGDVAAQWMAIAQAFAGPPGTGRRPGANTLDGFNHAPGVPAVQQRCDALKGRGMSRLGQTDALSRTCDGEDGCHEVLCKG